MDEVNFPYPHDTDPDIFREALSYSEAMTGFTANLIEKDYYCSLILKYFFDLDTPLVFKGGTCLSKVFADFYRLSEDLDFIIPVAGDTPRNQRRSEMDSIKGIFMVRKKLDVPGNIPVDFSLEHKRELDRQLEGQLRPVLRPADFDSFNMEKAFELIGRVAKAVSG
jgi:predicted nucleotidyltransferase component of viral defense system